MTFFPVILLHAFVPRCPRRLLWHRHFSSPAARKFFIEGISSFLAFFPQEI